MYGPAQVRQLSTRYWFPARQHRVGTGWTFPEPPAKLGRLLTRRARLTWLYALLAASSAATYRLAVFDGFGNDHYMHLAWAQQLLHGEIPGRDFFEPGMPLMIALSAAAQWLGGAGLVSELMLCVAFLSLTAALTFWLGARITGSLPMGLLAAAIEIALTPRLYNYPKLFVHVVGLWLIWLYVERPSSRRATALGAWLAVAFLFRHDFLIFLGLTTLVAIAVAPRPSAAPSRLGHAGVCAVAALIAVLPYLAFVEATTGLVTHMRHAQEFAREERWGLDVPQFVFAPRVEAPDAGTLRPAGPIRAAVRGAWLDTVDLLAPVVNRTNAVGLLFWAALALPALLLLGSVAVRRGAKGWAASVRDPRVFCLGTLLLILAVVFFRSPIRARVADVAGPLSVAIVLAISVAWRRNHGLAAGGIMAGALVASVLHGNVWNRVYAIGAFDGSVVERLSTRRAELLEWPWASAWPNGRLPPVIEYLNACTEPNDRVFVTWFAPEIHVFANRRFAAGHAYLLGRSHLSTEYQQLMLQRLMQENVPVVLMNGRERPWLASRYPLVAAYLGEHYGIAGTYYTETGDEIDVATRRDTLPTRADDATGWPCFRD